MQCIATLNNYILLLLWQQGMILHFTTTIMILQWHLRILNVQFLHTDGAAASRSGCPLSYKQQQSYWKSSHKLSPDEHKAYKPASRFLEPSVCTGNPVTWAMWNLIGSNLPPVVILQRCHTYINKQETREMHQYPKIAVFWDVTPCSR